MKNFYAKHFENIPKFRNLVYIYTSWQHWSLFQTPIPILFQNLWIRVRLFFSFENPTPVQTPARIIEPIVIYPCFYLRNGHTDSCYCRNGKVAPRPSPVFRKFLTPDPGPKEKRRNSGGPGPVPPLLPPDSKHRAGIPRPGLPDIFRKLWPKF